MNPRRKEQLVLLSVGGLVLTLITPRWWAALAVGLAPGAVNLNLLGFFNP